MESKVKGPHSISRTCLAQEFGLVFLFLQITRHCKGSLVSLFVIHIHTSYMSLLLRHLRPVKVLIFATRVGVPWVSIGVFSVVVGVPDSLVGVLKIGIFC